MIRYLFILLFTFSAHAATDIRMCSVVNRDADGSIHRSTSVLRDYQKIHPCPSTGATIGRCPGWALDHVIPLACGGCDSIENLQWLKNTIKSCAGTECKDRWERRVYCNNAGNIRRTTQVETDVGAK